MDALSGLKWIAASLFAQLMSCCPLFAYSISSRKGDLNQPIPAQPDTGKSWIFDTNCIFWGKEGGNIGKKKQHLF
ncbi:hypothetical protein ES703_70229 [subsurface metagenome]